MAAGGLAVRGALTSGGMANDSPAAAGTVAAGSVFRISLSWDATGYTIALGTTTPVDRVATMPGGLTTLRIAPDAVVSATPLAYRAGGAALRQMMLRYAGA
jgi:hypothetical protein